MNTWYLRDEILAITHRWYLILVFILAGSLFGWVGSRIWPASYRATSELYVGLNAYRAADDSYASSLAGQTFDLVDDYKHWQMAQLREVVLSDDFLEETLSALRSQDPYWKGFSPQAFRRNAQVLWRNPGEWKLVVEGDAPVRARQAVEAWTEVVLDKGNQAIEHARSVVSLDIQMSIINEILVNLELRQDRMANLSAQLSVWIERLDSMPKDHHLSSIDHWEILGLVSQAANWDPVWDGLLDDAPVVGSTPDQYLEWLEHPLALIETELGLLPGQISLLKQNAVSINQLYRAEAGSSMGVASTLVIDKIADERPKVEPVRHDGTVVLVGGMIGFSLWAVWQAVDISRKRSA